MEYCYSNKKLYELAPLLSPSIYETIFYNQYEIRADKNAIILDDKVFDDVYIDEKIYRNFILSNSNRLGKSLNYLGLNQMHGGIINNIEIDNNNKLTLTLLDTGVDKLAKTLIETKAINLDIKPFIVKIIFEDVYYYSNHTIDKEEFIIKNDDNIIEKTYIQDQITLINDNEIEIVISIQDKEEKLSYYIIKCKNISVIDEARDTWLSTFYGNDFAMLYDYFINTRKTNKLVMNRNVCISIIAKYEEFISQLDIS
ncbi:hypothetical protein R4J18_05320 [Brachyspira pilosicoli]|uniref:hypothetical protein n=1 Tax=Brachyspira pilosicoli TaxID=52584 RepID=UPI003003FA4A